MACVRVLCVCVCGCVACPCGRCVWLCGRCVWLCGRCGLANFGRCADGLCLCGGCGVFVCGGCGVFVWCGREKGGPVAGPPLCGVQAAVSYSPTPWRVQYHRRWQS